ncbi:hypothetical protein HDR66_03015 [bacterium]|nr:hypothetical protein [bacterium]
MKMDTSDAQLLKGMAGKKIALATSPEPYNGTRRFYYYFPKSANDVESALAIFKKYGVDAMEHMSSLNDRAFPIIRIPIYTNNFAAQSELAQMMEDINNATVQKSIKSTPTVTNDTQKEQLSRLQDMIDGFNGKFQFVSAKDSPLNVKSYTYECKSDDEYFAISQTLGENGLYMTSDGHKTIIITENEFDRQRAQNSIKKQQNPEKYINTVTEPIGQVNGHDVYLEAFGRNSIVENAGRALAVVNINGKSLPFYVSSGQAGKDAMGIPSGHWYPLMGIGQMWYNKMPDMMNNPYPELDQVVALLEQKFPAAQLKPIALKNEITHQMPHVNTAELMRMANKDLPEGAQDTHYGKTYTRLKNELVYLPSIIHAWREPPKAYLETDVPALRTTVQEIIHKIQPEIFAEITEHDGLVQFIPNENMSASQIRQELSRMGFTVDEHLAISGDDLINQYLFPPKQKKAHEFAKGQISAEIKAKAKGAWNRFKGMFTDSYEK